MKRASAALLLAALSWGLALTTADRALAEVSATDLLFLEIVAGTLVVIGFCFATGRKVGGAWRPALVLGSLEPGIAYVFANVGLVLTSAAVGSMLFALESVFVVLIAGLLLRTRPRRMEVLALTLGVIGTVLVATARDGGQSSGLGVAIMVASTLISAVYVLVTRRFAGDHEPVALVARQGMASLLVTAPFILGATLNGGSRLATASVESILLACLTGVIGFAIPYTLWTIALPHVRPGFAAVALNLVPLVGVAGATLLGQGRLTGIQWFGGGLILIGLVALTWTEITGTQTPEPTQAPKPDLIPVPTLLPIPTMARRVRPTPTLPGPRRSPDLTPAPTPATWVHPAPALVPVQAPALATPTQAPRARSTFEADQRNPVHRIPIQGGAAEAPLPQRLQAAANTRLEGLRAGRADHPARVSPTTAVPGGTTQRAAEPGETEQWHAEPWPLRPGRLRPGRAGQDGQRMPGARPVSPGLVRPGPDSRNSELERTYRWLLDWLHRQRDVDPGADMEAIAFIVTGAITQYELLSRSDDEPFGIAEERYLAAVADLAATSLSRLSH